MVSLAYNNNLGTQIRLENMQKVIKYCYKWLRYDVNKYCGSEQSSTSTVPAKWSSGAGNWL